MRGITVAQGEVMSDMWLAMSTDPDMTEPVTGIETKEPAFGLPALWVESDVRESAEIAGYTVVSSSAVVSTHLTEVIRRYAADILSRNDVQNLIDNVKKTSDSLVSDLIPDQLSVAEVHVILQQLLKEKVCVRDMVTILESLSYHCRVSKSPDYLIEQCRTALSRSICKQHQHPETGELPAITLAPEVEEQLAQGLGPAGQGNQQSHEMGSMLALSPSFTQELLNRLSKEVEQAISRSGVQPVILCNAKLRMPFRRLTERIIPQIAILSYNEVGPATHVQSVGLVKVN
jgi:flagellar biosynthesis protein FlhA